MARENVSFYADSMDPIRLEGILEFPDGAGPFPTCIICHPHPIGGGSMHLPLMEDLALALSRRGWACLRFNFRGVGRSSGESTGGLLEVEDVEGAFRYLEEREDTAVDGLALAGWSFGSWVGLRWAVGSGRCRRAALVSPPMVGFDFFQFLGEKGAVLPEDSFVVCGSRDQFSDREKLEELAARLGAELRILDGADHFLFGYEMETARIVADHWSGS